MITRDWNDLLPRHRTLAAMLRLDEDELDHGDEVWQADLGDGALFVIAQRKPTRGWWDAEVRFDSSGPGWARMARTPEAAVRDLYLAISDYAKQVRLAMQATRGDA